MKKHTSSTLRTTRPALRVRHGRGAQSGTGGAHRRHDADRGARTSRVSAALGLREIAIVRAAPGTNRPMLPTAGSEADILRARIRDVGTGCRNQNIEQRDGDTIFVPRAESVYVFGEGKSPGACIIQKGTTVLQSRALARRPLDGLHLWNTPPFGGAKDQGPSPDVPTSRHGIRDRSWHYVAGYLTTATHPVDETTASRAPSMALPHN